ncbi:MAG: hypothetical protein MUE65_06600, partial [Methanomassiliicoccales archaeon]|nr:hypothetical protein [Methanomassiliicoccales archaeon]
MDPLIEWSSRANPANSPGLGPERVILRPSNKSPITESRTWEAPEVVSERTRARIWLRSTVTQK